MTANRIERAWCIGSAVLGVLLLSFSTLHYSDNADTFIPALVSTQHLTLFYWGQNRSGMLLPLLCRWIENPLWNHCVQSVVGVACVYTVFFLLPRCLGLGRFANQMGFVALALFILEFQHPSLFTLCSSAHPYAVSMPLFLLGWEALRAGKSVLRASIGLGLFTLALWVNIGLLPFAACLMVATLVLRRRAAPPFALGALGVAFVLNYGIASVYPFKNGHEFGLTPDWLRALERSLANLSPRVAWPVVAAAVACGGLGGALTARRTSGSRVAIGMGIAAFGAVGVFSANAGLIWVEMNQFDSRYFTPALVLAAVAQAVPIAYGLRRRPVMRCGITILVATACLGVQIVRYPPRSVSQLRAFWDEANLHLAETLLKKNVEIVLGSEWTLWPAVFLAETERRNGHSPVLGGSLRADAFRASLTSRIEHGARAAFRTDELPHALNWISWFSQKNPVQFVPTERVGPLTVGYLYPDDGRIADRPPLYETDFYRPLALNETVALNRSDGDGFLGMGWGTADGTTRPTVGRCSDIVFALASDHPASIEIGARPFLVPGLVSRQRIDISLNGVDVAHPTLISGTEETIRIRVPQGILRGRNVLRLRLPDAFSPRAVAVNQDSRVLALTVSTLRVRSDRPDNAKPDLSRKNGFIG